MIDGYISMYACNRSIYKYLFSIADAYMYGVGKNADILCK